MVVVRTDRGDVKGNSLFRIGWIRRSIFAVLLMGVFVACMPNDAGAASGSPRIATSTYQSGQWCDSEDGESFCAIKSGGTFTLMEIDGLHFTQNGVGLV